MKKSNAHCPFECFEMSGWIFQMSVWIFGEIQVSKWSAVQNVQDCMRSEVFVSKKTQNWEVATNLNLGHNFAN
jgi:hypothetical protein